MADPQNEQGHDPQLAVMEWLVSASPEDRAIDLPYDFVPLGVQARGGQLVLFGVGTPNAPVRVKSLYILTTGTMREWSWFQGKRYIGSAQFLGGDITSHVWMDA